MYLPKHFEANDSKHLFEVMRLYNFATLVNTQGGAPFATHLPVLVREDPGQGGLVIDAHVARANPQWRALQDDPRALVIFQGPHAYISPTNYISKSRVPTWNYVAVHAEGTVRVIESSAEKLAILARLIEFHEPSFAPHFSSFDAKTRDSLVGAIVGMEIKVDTLQGKFKLNQHRLADDLPVLQKVFEHGDENHRGLASWMKKLGYWPAHETDPSAAPASDQSPDHSSDHSPR